MATDDNKRTGHFDRDDKPTGKFRFDPSFNMGSVVSAMLYMGVMAVGWGKMQADNTNRDNAFADYRKQTEQRVDELKRATEIEQKELRQLVQQLVNGQTETNLSVRELQVVIREEGRKNREQ